MIRIIRDTIDKAELQQMPVMDYGGRIAIIQSVSEADRAVSFLRTFPVSGFDTETRPSFKKGQSHKVALMQIAVHDICFLFRLNRIGFPPTLCNYLSDKSVRKVGLSLKDDFMMIRERTDVELNNFVDLQAYVRPFGIKDQSLQKLYANIFGKRISKAQQRSNWEADVLTERQQKYAALDAWACLVLYEELEQVRATGDYRVLTTIQEEAHGI